MTTEPAAAAWTPPYIPFRTLTNLIGRMEAEGVPRRIDRSYLSSMAGGMQAAVLAAFRALGFTEPNGEVLPALTDIIDFPDRRAELMRAIITEKYGFAWRLGEDKATQGELEEAFKAQGISGSTLRKAIAFYVRASQYAGMPLSPFFQLPRDSGDATVQRARARKAPARRRKQVASPRSSPVVHAAAVERDSRATTDEMKRRYFDMLIAKAESAEADPDKELLDRIERLLGLAEQGGGKSDPQAV